MSKTIKISVQEYNQIHSLCEELGINPAIYDEIEKRLAGKLIFDLSHILIFKKALLKSGAITAPAPENYQRGGKYDL
ncbi:MULTISPECIES: hypothetical protein [unclassified Fusobacterium]|uniref:hypothetical protein n=1 Tax=unclassified Fusobacterium TaxID=2648384 RepID=UPI001B8B0FFB|nr:MULTISPECIES: hypothetical protein [unclassified Fusobacterium]MBR8702083.1 hypothetical protein [Fusobacterium sp. DD45]MBR8711885.1 hypothetical protein [Fusobacterium sp. DD28]MBR8752462.1 hypothetical protein [Fusobacterium sp. DD26]